MSDLASPTTGAPSRRGGRPPDPAVEAEVLAATLEALAEQGYDQLTLDLVAHRTGRAKTTVYRRWPTKLDLVLAAVRAVGRPPESQRLPDTGSLRTDLLAVVDSPWLGGPAHRLVLLDGLVAAARTTPALADAVRNTITEPYVEVYAGLLRQAARRGEIGPAYEGVLPLVAQVVPAMASHRLSAGDAAVGASFFVDVIDHVVLPSVGLRPPG